MTISLLGGSVCVCVFVCVCVLICVCVGVNWPNSQPGLLSYLSYDDSQCIVGADPGPFHLS